MKTFSFKVDPLTGEEYYEVYLRGQQLLNDPLLNKASAFTEEERLSLELSTACCARASRRSSSRCSARSTATGASPTTSRSTSTCRACWTATRCSSTGCSSTTSTEMVPIVYTPTVGQACLQLSHITRRYRGIYLSPDNIGHIDQIFQSVSLPSVS